MEGLIAQYLIDTDHYNQSSGIDGIEEGMRGGKVCYKVIFLDNVWVDNDYITLEDLLVYLFKRTQEK